MKKTLFALSLCIVAQMASAHSPLQETSPANGAVVASAPNELTFTFKRNIRLTRVSWAREGGQKAQLEMDGQAGFATDFAFPFPANAPGSYTIEWRGLGDDGHPQKGSFSFSID